MDEIYLTLEQNLCAARIFLNMFGFVLENSNDVNEFSKIKIFNKRMSEVGYLYFDNGKVVISAEYDNATLKADYGMPKVTSFVDVECKTADFALFGEWVSTINFEISGNDTNEFKGEILIDSSIDTEFGVNCICHPLISCSIPDKGEFTMKILRNGLMFGLDIKTNDSRERIEVNPWDDLNGFFLHDIKRGIISEEKYLYLYRRYAGVFNGAEKGEKKDKLHVFLKEKNQGEVTDYYNEFIQKVGKDDSRKSLIQKGSLMKQLDASAFQRIEELRKILVVDDVSLLDNFISVCYDSYTDDEIEALLGMKRERMQYQDGAGKLINSYFGIGNKNIFLPPEEQKKLLKG